MFASTRRSFLRNLATASVAATLPRVTFAQTASSASRSILGRELTCDVLIIGGSVGGIAPALAVARAVRTAIVSEETSWIGGQATTLGVPLDEHPWIEDFGSTRSFRQFRTGLREYYRRHY